MIISATAFKHDAPCFLLVTFSRAIYEKSGFQHIVYKHMIDFPFFSHTEKTQLGHICFLMERYHWQWDFPFWNR